MPLSKISHPRLTTPAVSIVTGLANREKAVGIVYLDFSKSFEKVCHGLAKINVRLTHRRLFNCTQLLLVNSSTLTWIKVPSEVPQGSVSDLEKDVISSSS